MKTSTKYYFLFMDYIKNPTIENLKITLKKLFEEARKDNLL